MNNEIEFVNGSDLKLVKESKSQRFIYCNYIIFENRSGVLHIKRCYIFSVFIRYISII